METREELLKGLHYVKNMIVKIMGVQQEQVRIVAQYREEKTGISTTGLKNRTKLFVIIIGVAAILFHLAYGMLTGEMATFYFLLFAGGLAFWKWKKNKRGKKLWASIALIDGLLPIILLAKYISFWVMFIIIALIVFFAVGFVIKKKNSQVEEHNLEVNRQNSELQVQYDETVQQLAELKKELFGKTSSWYPKSYYSLNAVEFFISAIENYRADSVKEMVNLFETTKEQKQMLKTQAEINSSLKQQTLNQEQIKQQMKYANVLNMANLFMQSGTQASINANTNSAVRNTERLIDSVRDIGRKL